MKFEIKCPYCNTIQVQIVNYSNGRVQYKCRECFAASPVIVKSEQALVDNWRFSGNAG